MRHLLPILVCFACSSEMVVRTDFDKSVEIHRKKYYGWLDKKEIESRNNPLFYNELNDKRVKEAVNLQMAGKGYTLSQDKPEMLIHYHFVIEDKSTIEMDPYGYYYNPYWEKRGLSTYQYQEGTFILDFMDATNCQLIWRGWAVSILDETHGLSQQMIDHAVVKIFQKFPVSASKEIVTP